VEAFPVKEDQGMLFEGPLRTRDSDCLGFADYAEVLASRLQDPAAWPDGLGIFAQWGAGKVRWEENLELGFVSSILHYIGQQTT